MRVHLSIFHIRELKPDKREVVVRAYSTADAATLVAGALNVAMDHVCDETRFRIQEVNYGADFLHAGGRGVIARF